MSTIEGKRVPELKLAATLVGAVQLPEDLLGHYTLIYFYPKDDTPGCTKQACAFRDDLSRFDALSVPIYGVSLDDLASHRAFADKFSLNFPLLSDPDHALADFFGVYGPREWQGNKFMGLSRDSFLIDPEGKVARAFRGVDPVSNASAMYEAVARLIGK